MLSRRVNVIWMISKRAKAKPIRTDLTKTKPRRFVDSFNFFLTPKANGEEAIKRPAHQVRAWQLFIHAVLYGWERKKDKRRRFRVAYVEVPRKNGKSIIAAGNGLWMFAPDNEYGAEVYCGATTEKQAWEVFKPAKKMAEALPNLRRSFLIDVMAKKMERPDGSIFEPVIGDPGDGSSHIVPSSMSITSMMVPNCMTPCQQVWGHVNNRLSS